MSEAQRPASRSELSRRQIVFDWLMDEKGYWGGEQEVAKVDALLAALDAVSERGTSLPELRESGRIPSVEAVRIARIADQLPKGQGHYQIKVLAAEILRLRPILKRPAER